MSCVLIDICAHPTKIVPGQLHNSSRTLLDLRFGKKVARFHRNKFCHVCFKPLITCCQQKVLNLRLAEKSQTRSASIAKIGLVTRKQYHKLLKTFPAGDRTVNHATKLFVLCCYGSRTNRTPDSLACSVQALGMSCRGCEATCPRIERFEIPLSANCSMRHISSNSQFGLAQSTCS